ncbi:hypothetical protein BD779DRAFT_848347 [Infundibulicybe gibba]|nr:hypothetical protein BD779DRAFT_848347 [Infundibulicybe gibba]
MHISQPLLSTNPELIVLEFPGFREYRVENWRLARDGSRRIIWGVSGWTLWDTVMALIVSIVWPWVIDHYWRLTATCFLVAYLVWSRLTQIVSESVIILPPHGIQLETHRHPN